MSWKRAFVAALCAGSLLPGGNATTIQGDPARFKTYTMKTPISGPCDVGSGPDERVYIQEFLANKIVKLDQYSGQLTEHDIPFSPPAPGLSNVTIPIPGHGKFFLLSCAIRTGYDDFMYFSNGDHNQLVRYNVTSAHVDVFTPPGLLQPAGNLQPLNDLTTTPEGVFFSQTTANVLTKFDYNTHQFTNFNVPTSLAVPIGMYYAQDGGVWFLEFAGNKIGRLDPVSGAIKEYPIAGPDCGPVVMRAETVDKDGRHMLWFACTRGSSLGGIDPATGHTVQIPTTTPLSFPVEVAQDYNDNVWVSYLLQDKLGVYNTKTGNYTEVVYPDAIVSSTPIANLPPYLGSGIFSKPVGQPFSGSGVGNAVWFSQTAANKVVRFDLDGFVVP